jgi:tRNA-Thr(GGU) m(6)t(6)A37 methyltransferase TsaA
MRPIGKVRSCFGGKFGVPRQPGLAPTARAELVLEPWCRSGEAVRGLDGFSHVWLIFVFHEVDAQGWKPTVRPPRLGGNQRVGVFASRSPFRPNPLGLSVVRLDGIREDPAHGPVLMLSGIDLVDGTPVLDIKPYVAYADALPEAQGSFASEAPGRLGVVVAVEAQERFERLDGGDQAVILEVLSLDPRPAIHAESGRVYGASLCGHNVRFRIQEGICQILAIG